MSVIKTFGTPEPDPPLEYRLRRPKCFDDGHLNPLCDLNNDDEILDIAAGEVFQIAPFDGGIKLVGNRGNSSAPEIVEGYIGKTYLDKLNNRAVVTYATLPHPRYTLKVIETDAANTKCGEKLLVGKERVVKGSLSEAEREVIEGFGLAQITNDGKQLHFAKSYGSDTTDVEFSLFKVTERINGQPSTKTFLAQKIYRCDPNSILNERVFIESVTILNVDRDMSTKFTPFGTPDDLYKFIGAPYMYSVNNSNQYFKLMDKLAEQFENRALAGFFLSVFNRSCKGKHRKTEPKCKHNAYD